MQLKYDNGVVSEVKGFNFTMPFHGLAKLQSKLVNGKLEDPNAIYVTGNNFETPIAYSNGEAQPKGNLTYYNRTGEKVNLSVNQQGIVEGPFELENENEGIIFLGEIKKNDEVEGKSVIKIRYWDIGNSDLYPKKIEVRGKFTVDMVNKKWGGENLTVTFPGTDLVLKGNFIPAYGFTVSVAPTGKHTLTGTWKGKPVNLTSEYKDGVLVSGEELYKINSNPPTKPTALSFDLVKASYGLSTSEKEIKLPVHEAKGIAIERTYDDGKNYEVEIVFVDENGKECYSKVTELGRNIRSIDFSSVREHWRHDPLKWIVIKRKKRNSFLRIHFYDVGH